MFVRIEGHDDKENAVKRKMEEGLESSDEKKVKTEE
jgi:hypothetical protein